MVSAISLRISENSSQCKGEEAVRWSNLTLQANFASVALGCRDSDRNT